MDGETYSKLRSGNGPDTVPLRHLSASPPSKAESWSMNSANVRMFFGLWFLWQVYRLLSRWFRKPDNNKGNLKVRKDSYWIIKIHRLPIHGVSTALASRFIFNRNFESIVMCALS